MTAPSIACLGVVGRNNNPLHIQIFPSYNPLPPDGVTIYAPLRTSLQYSLILSSSLDIFASRSSPSMSSTPQPHHLSKTPSSSQRDGVKLSGDYGLITVVDERLQLYGFETNTGVKFIVIIDLRGKRVESIPEGNHPANGLGAVRDGDVRVVFKAIQTAYIRLLQNPFFEPDAHSPTCGKGGKKIQNRRFEGEIKRIGEAWKPGVTTLQDL